MIAPTLLLALPLLAPLARDEDPNGYGAVFDEHWETLRDHYPYFERYGVDWEAERAEHRPRAVAAESPSAFAWEMAKLMTCLRDAHTSFLPAPATIQNWALPELETLFVGGRAFVIDLGDGAAPFGPDRYRDDPRAYPEIVSIEGVPLGSAAEILAAGPPGTSFRARFRWPDGDQTEETIQRPDTPGLPPFKKHYGTKWIHSGRVGDVGYLRIRTFNPSQGTLGPAGKMTPILREHLEGLLDTKGLVIDLQGNGGGLVGASDPFLSHFLPERRSYAWGRSNGQERVLVPRSPRYTAPVVMIVDERSASGGEWSARILRDAGRAVVVGGKTMGAEAAVRTFVASDGSTLKYSGWPMAEPGVEEIQDRGVTLDHPVHLTIELARELGIEEARARVRRGRFGQALEVLEAPAQDLDALIALADEADREEETEDE